MPLPSAISEQLAIYQDLNPSVERSEYAETKEIWAEGSGQTGQELTAADQLTSFGTKTALAYGAYKFAPSGLNAVNQLTNQTRFQKWALSGDVQINSIADVFKIRTGKEAMKTIRSHLFKNFKETINITYDGDVNNYWYSGLKKLEQRGLGTELSIFDNVVKLFTKATYLSDVLSYSVKREGKSVLNVGMDSLGATNRTRTLDLYSKQLGMDRKRLDLIDHLVFEDGNVFEGVLDIYGKVNVKSEAKALNAKKARLVDKGMLSEAMLTIIDPFLGMKDPHTGGTYAEKIGGSEGFVLFSNEEIDKDLGNLIDRFDVFKAYAKRKNLSPKGNLRRYANDALMVESYSTMAVTRTSRLVTEMYNEVGSFFEYMFPQAKKSVYGFLSKNKLIPKVQHGHGMAMLSRYTAGASKIAVGLAAINQLGWNMQHGGAIASISSGAIQAAGLAYIGGLLGKKSKKSGLGAAIGGGLGVAGMMGLGPFAGGPVPGVANVIARGNEIRSYVGEATGMNAWRRKVEEVMPGSTGVISSLGIGTLGAVGYVSATRFLNKDVVVESRHRAEYLRAKFGETKGDIRLEQITDRVRDDRGKIQKLRENFLKSKPRLSDSARVTEEATLEQEIRNVRQLNTNKLSAKQVDRIENEIAGYGKSLSEERGKLANLIGKTADDSNFTQLSETLTDFSHEASRQKILKTESSPLKRMLLAIGEAPRLKATLYAATLGAAAWMVGTGGLGTKERPSELRELNQGRRLEAVRRGQKWEMGQTGYAGDDILYYRPTLTARLSSGATQAGASGNRGALEEMFLKNFTYQLERENYWKRPAPITGAAFDQVPFIYPIIQPLTDLIKAPKIMHLGEWSRASKGGDKIEYLERSTGLEELPDQSLGGISMPAPASPYSPGRVFGKMWQEVSSVAGLVGYYGKTAKRILTGTAGFGDQRAELESFSENMDLDSQFYDLQGGGSFLSVPFTSEVIRRFLHENDVEQYNPIKNTMPSWMPESFQYGNQYTSLRYGEGEYRMPGEGYEALHPELKGINPEYYPLLHKLNIMADIAPYSPQYKSLERQADIMQMEGDMTSEEIGFLERRKQMVSNKTNKRDYSSYEFKPSTYDTFSGSIASVDPGSMTFTMSGYGGRFGVAGISNDSPALISEFNLSIKEAAKLKRENSQAFASNIKVGDSVTVDVAANIGKAVDASGVIKASIRNNGFNINKEIRSEGQFAEDNSQIKNYAMTNYVERLVGGGWEALTHAANSLAQPVEHLMMFGAAPINKLLPFRDALEDYEAREVYGTEMKGWESPITGWIAPALKTAIHNWTGLDFESPGLAKKRETEEYFDKLKYLKYNQLSEAATKQGNDLLAKQYATVASRTNIGGTGYVSQDRLANVLGGREAMFAQGFANELNPVRQGDILAALPGHKRRLLEGFYLNQDLEAINRAASAGSMSTYGMDYAADLSERKETEGFDIKSSSGLGEARVNEVSQFFRHKSLPKVDWIGFNPAVDLEDVKLKYIQSEGMDYHDFGIYPSRASYMPRKPYISEKDVQDINNFAYSNPIVGMADVAKVHGGYGMHSYNIQGPSRDQSFINFTSNQTVDINPFES
jgi:hypothetical protein